MERSIAKHVSLRHIFKGICLLFVQAPQFDLLSDGTSFKVDMYVREILFHRPYEACENSNTDIEELFSQPR